LPLGHSGSALAHCHVARAAGHDDVELDIPIVARPRHGTACRLQARPQRATSEFAARRTRRATSAVCPRATAGPAPSHSPRSTATLEGPRCWHCPHACANGPLSSSTSIAGSSALASPHSSASIRLTPARTALRRPRRLDALGRHGTPRSGATVTAAAHRRQ
jgi:hypothetical protein